MVLFISGNWFWVEGWIFGLWLVALCYAVLFYMYFFDPELYMERTQRPGREGEKGWDRYFMYWLYIGFTLWLVISPLDERFKWTSNFPWVLEVIGFIFLVVCFYLFLKSYMDNTYLSPLVRIQKERNQKLISTGVYAWVSHPMYLEAILFFLGGPLLMGSIYGLLIGILLSLSVVARTWGEEQMLVEELDGYVEYKTKVKYSLIPYLW
jgi:protein-S-isoprenylcysteine O-methyltransferase Ste14